MSPCSSCVRYSLQRYIRVDSYVCAGARAPGALPGARASTEPSSPLSNIVLCVLRDSALAVAPAQRARVIINLMRVDRRRASRLTSCRGPCGIVHREAHPGADLRAATRTTYVVRSNFDFLAFNASHTSNPSATVSRNPTMPAPNKPDANVKSSHSCTLAVPVLGSWLVRFLPESKVTDVIS